jgi:hypothetical protein
MQDPGSHRKTRLARNPAGHRRHSRGPVQRLRECRDIFFEAAHDHHSRDELPATQVGRQRRLFDDSGADRADKMSAIT